MLKYVLNLLMLVTLSTTTAISFLIRPVDLAASQAKVAMQSPISPLPPGDNDSDDDESNGDELDANGLKPSTYIWLPQAHTDQMWIKTHQIGLGWWDEKGELHIAQQVNGIIKIDLKGVTMISIPLDAAGFAVPPGWKKIMRPQNGEWVIVPL